MARDYAKKQSHKNSVPGWVWLLAGLSIGLFAAFLVYLNKMPAQGPVDEAAREVMAKINSLKAKVEKGKADIDANADKEEKSGLKFDFYSMLPEFEVLVPEDEIDAASGQQRTPEALVKYIFQVGSFRSTGDADTRRAQLALLGMKSKIQTVTIDGKKTWHRVRIGPYQERAELNRVRRLLHNNEIEFIVMKSKDGDKRTLR